MGWKAQINFRATATYVTDQHGETYSAKEAYPTNRAGLVFGWDTAGDVTRDRDNLIDRRLAGIYQKTNDGTQATFTLSLIAPGWYRMKIAHGDAGSAQSYNYLQVLDNARPILTMDDTDGTGSTTSWNTQHTRDFAATAMTDTEWASQAESAMCVYFTSVLLKIKLGSPTAQLSSSTIAHLYVERVATSAAQRIQFMVAAGNLAWIRA